GAAENSLMMRLRPGFEFAAIQKSGPRIEQLINIGAFADERLQEVDSRRLQPFQERLPDSRLFRGEAPRGGEVLAGVDAISRHGEGRSGKGDHRQLAAQLFLHALQKLNDVQKLLRRRLGRE